MKNIFLLFLLTSTLFSSVNQITMLQEACQNNHPSACYELGLLYEEGIGIDKNETTAKSYYTHACDNTIHEACNALDRMTKK